MKAWGKQIGMPTHSHALRLEPASADTPACPTRRCLLAFGRFLCPPAPKPPSVATGRYHSCFGTAPSDGTASSNPLSSSGESANFRSLSRTSRRRCWFSSAATRRVMRSRWTATLRQRSAIGGQPENICSLRGLPPMTKRSSGFEKLGRVIGERALLDSSS